MDDLFRFLWVNAENKFLEALLRILIPLFFHGSSTANESADVASTIADMVDQPEYVDVNEMIIRLRKQEI